MTSTINLFTQSFNRFANLSLNKSNSHRIQLFQVNVSNVADTICGVLQTRIIGPLLLADTICGVLQTRIIGPLLLADTIYGVLQTRIIGPLLLADTICGVLQTSSIGPLLLPCYV